MPKLGDLEEFLMFSGLASHTGRWLDLRPQGALAAIALDAVWGHMHKLQYGGWRV